MKDVIIFYRDNENANAIAFIKNNLEEIFGHYINLAAVRNAQPSFVWAGFCSCKA